MKTIIIINDGSAEAKHAGELALQIARKIDANLLLANAQKAAVLTPVKEYVLTSGKTEAGRETVTGLTGYLKSLAPAGQPAGAFNPDIEEVDISAYHEKELIQLIVKRNIWMIVKGLTETPLINHEAKPINIHAVLNSVRCPLLIVPAHFRLKEFERIVYMADLRYCRMLVLKHLVELAKPYQASLMVAHISAEGLVPIEDHYAASLFCETFSNKVKYDGLIFNNIKERDAQKALDIMVHEMQTDMVVVVNHRFHFEEIVGCYITEILPEHITIPLMVFPY
ncbi:universal stress protein [Mucilaginibacter sp.]|uniref:universal stress protein n=1 Tax=Mucilaginibacter sp. TaxID=1882438 RepID=UPI00374DA900